MTNTIHRYHPSQKKRIRDFCNDFYTKGKSRRLFDAVVHQGKRWWTYGVAAIVAHAVTGHGLYGRGLSSRFTSVHSLVVELTLWTAGFGLAWYSWLSHLYKSQVKEMTRKLMAEMDRVCLEPKSNVWVMIDTATMENGRILGVAILDCHQVAPVEEGQIQVAALASHIHLALVENAIRFARQQDIKVITQDHKKNRLDSF